MRNKKTKIIRIFIIAAFFLLAGLNYGARDAQAALKRIGVSCNKGAECKSGFCGGDFKCEGKVAEGESCSITDEKLACRPGYYCHGDTLQCTFDSRPTSPSTSNTVNNPNPAATVTGGATEFVNPLQFKTVDQFLTTIMNALQKIIVSLSLLMIVYGAVLYVTSGGGKQTETAKGAITAALVGLAIGMAAPSFLKEIASIIGWGGTTPAALSLSEIAINALNFLLGILGILSLVMLVIGASMYLTSAGDEGRIDTGKKIFKSALLGVIIAMASMVMVSQVAQFFITTPSTSSVTPGSIDTRGL